MKRIKFPYTVKDGNIRVPIYKSKSAVGYISYQIPDYSQGKRTIRTFGKKKLSLAIETAENIARKLAAGEVAALGLGSRERASYGRAIQLLAETNTPLELAAARYAEAVKIVGDGAKLIEAAKFFAVRNPSAFPAKSVSVLVDELISTKEGRRKSARYISDLRSRLGRFAKTFQVNVVDVTTAKIQEWLDGLDVAPQSYINYRRVLYGLFAFAEARGYIFKGTNPVEDVESIEAADGEVAIFTPAEFVSLLNVAGKSFLPCLAIGGFSGLRSAEIERLDWSDIDLRGRYITISAGKAKTASRRVVPVCDALAAWLAPHVEKGGRVWKGTHDEFYEAQQETARSTRVKANRKKGIKAQAALKWKHNGLRHSYASYRLTECGDDARVAQELGNSRGMVHKHYKALAKPDDAKSWFSIKPGAEGQDKVIWLKLA